MAIFRERANGNVVDLLDMTYEQLVKAATSHYDAGRDELRRAGRYKLLAIEMQAGQRVRDRWTAEEIAQTWEQVDIKFGYRRAPEAIGATTGDTNS